MTRRAGEPINRPDAPPVRWSGQPHHDRAASVDPRTLPGAKGSGAALPEPVADQMGAAFGQDFSDVRVHTDTSADLSARAIDAKAYTFGKDILFAAGRFAPHTEEGQRLLAHEIGHVIEQRAGERRLARQPAAQQVASPQTGQRDWVTAAIELLRGAAEFYGGRGRVSAQDARIGPLARTDLDAVPRILAKWLQMRDDAATMITTNLAGDAALTEQLRTAYRHAVRALLAAASSAVQPGVAGDAGRPSTDELYMRHQQLIHDWAWPDARLDPHRNDLLDAVPAAERAQIQIDTRELTIQGLANMFSPNVIIPALPRGTTVTLAPGIPAAQRQGLTNLAQVMVADRPPMLSVNRSATVRLDLSAQGGGKGTYRITQVQHAGAPGRPGQREVLVEHIATLGPERDQTQVRPGGQDLFTRHGFIRDTSWHDDAEFAQLLGALATIPESMLAGLDGIRFRRVARIPDRAAEYSLGDHSISVADNAFQSAGSLRAYQGPHQAAGGFQRLISHEVGHAIDWKALRGPLAAANASSDARNTFLRQHGRPSRGGQFVIPPDQVAAWRAVRAADDAAQLALGRARGESGARFQDGKITETLPRGEDGAFRAAAQRDGATRITAYSDTNWREYFAESFSFYVVDPEGLKQLRPNVYQFFAQHHPDPDRLP